MMTRLIFPFLVAFLAAIAGGSALILVKAKDAHAVALADFAAKKRKLAAGQGADSTGHGGARDSAAAGTDSAHGPAHGPAHGKDSAGAPRTAAAHDSAHPPAPTPVTLPPRGKPGAIGPVADTSSRRGAKAPPALTAEGKVAVSGAEAAQALGAEKKLAKIFSAMSPREAAKVLQQMEDADVRVILGHLGSKQAAAVLGNFPAPRAAELSRQSLKGPLGRGP